MADLQLRDLTPAFGTEVTGLDPQEALTDADTGRRLRYLFDTRGVLVFRDIEVDLVEQANLVRRLIGHGPLEPGESPTGRSGGEPFYVSNKEPEGGAPYGRLLFHSDMMWSEHTFQVLSLYGVEVEQPVSGTMFASAKVGWDTLPDQLRARVEGLSAVQGHAEGEARAGGDPDVLVSDFTNLPTRTTSIGHRHPRTGDTLLYVSQQMTSGIEGLSPEDGEELLEGLFAHLYRPEGLYEHDWREGDLVAWDNIALQHARPNVQLDGPARTLRKVFAPLPPHGSNPARPSFATAR